MAIPNSTARAGWTGFLVIAYALLLTMAGATLASPLYPLYQDAWGLAPSGITIAYTAYMAGALLALTSLGRISDHYGAVRVLRWAGILMIVSLLVSALAPNLVVLSISRFFIGLTAGTTIPAATVGLILAEPDRPRRIAPFVSSLTQMLGLGSGPLLGGVVAQFVPGPLLVPYLAFIAATLLGVVALFTLPAGARQPGRFRPAFRFQLPPPAVRGAFAISAAIAFLGFCVAALYTALTPSFLRDMLPWQGPLIGGAGVALIFSGAMTSQVVLRRIAPREGLTASVIIMAIGMAFLAGAVSIDSAPLFLVSVVLGGVGQGLALMAGVAVVTTIAPAETRASVVSAYFTTGYLGSILPLLVTGFAADAIGLDLSVVVLAVVTALVALTLAFLARTTTSLPGAVAPAR